MIEFGKTLRIAREAKGFTTSQIADKTHMLVQVVEGLENEDFSRIVAPIYGRGFVKHYCEAVGLEPKPLVDEFMEIYSGNREATIRERPVVESPAPDKKPVETKPVETKPAEEPVVTAAPAAAAPEPPPPPPEFDFAGIRTHAEPPAPGPSRYAAPMPIDDGPSFRLPEINWRMAVLAAAALAVIVLLVLGIRALYHATMDAPAEEVAQSAETSAEAKSEPAAEPAVKPQGESAAETPRTPSAAATTDRKPLPVQPFYID